MRVPCSLLYSYKLSKSGTPLTPPSKPLLLRPYLATSFLGVVSNVFQIFFSPLYKLVWFVKSFFISNASPYSDKAVYNSKLILFPFFLGILLSALDTQLSVIQRTWSIKQFKTCFYIAQRNIMTTVTTFDTAVWFSYYDTTIACRQLQPLY